MTREEIIRLAVGLAVPTLLAPFAVLGLRRLFAIFITEGVELFSTVLLEGDDAKTLGSLMAKLNVAVMLLAWLILFTCHSLDVQHLVVMGIALAGVTGAILITVATRRSSFENSSKDISGLITVGAVSVIDDPPVRHSG